MLCMWLEKELCWKGRGFMMRPGGGEVARTSFRGSDESESESPGSGSAFECPADLRHHRG